MRLAAAIVIALLALGPAALPAQEARLEVQGADTVKACSRARWASVSAWS